MRALPLLALVALGAVAQERQLIDEVVAVVDAHSVTLSELAAKTRIHMGELRVARYLDNRLKLAAQLRESELEEAWKAQGGQGDREALRQRLSKEKYERLLTELLGELRRKASVRIVDPLDDGTRSVAAGRR